MQAKVQNHPPVLLGFHYPLSKFRWQRIGRRIMAAASPYSKASLQSTHQALGCGHVGPKNRGSGQSDDRILFFAMCEMIRTAYRRPTRRETDCVIGRIGCGACDMVGCVGGVDRSVGMALFSDLALQLMDLCFTALDPGRFEFPLMFSALWLSRLCS